MNNLRALESELANQIDDSVHDIEELTQQILADPTLSQLTLRNSTSDFETQTNYIRCKFAKDQQRETVHIVLCPAMKAIPDVTGMILDDVEGDVRVTDSQKFGVRIEVVLSQAFSSSREVLVEVVTVAACNQTK